MPKIIQDSQQLSALHTVSANLETISQINALIEAGGTLYVTCGSRSKKGGEKNRPLVAVSEKLTGRIIATMEAQKAALVREINLLAKKYNIGLSDEEKALMKLSGDGTAKVHTEDSDESALDVSDTTDEDEDWTDEDYEEDDEDDYAEEAEEPSSTDNFVAPNRYN